MRSNDFDDTRDYVVATVLPSMMLHHDNVHDAVCEFTVDDARKIIFSNRPLIMNHHDGAVDTATGVCADHERVGTVLSSSVRHANAHVLAEIDPSLGESAKFSTRSVANGIYRSVSLGNDVITRVRASDGTTYVERIVTEVSLCKNGKRNNSLIEVYAPGRRTIEHLWHYDPGTLRDLVKIHGYDTPSNPLGVPFDDDARYISALVSASHQRLSDAIVRHGLRPDAVHCPMSNQASDNAAGTTTAPIDKATDAQVNSIVSGDAAPPPKDVPGGEHPPVVTKLPDTQSSIDARALADAAMTIEQENLSLKRRLADQSSVIEEARAIKNKKLDGDRKAFDTAVKSVLQHAIEAHMSDEDMRDQVDDLRERFSTNPERGLSAAHRAVALTAKAAQGVRGTITHEDTTRVEAVRDAATQQYISDVAKRLTAMRQEGAAIDLSQSSTTSPAATSTSSSTATSADTVLAARTDFQKRMAAVPTTASRTEAPASDGIDVSAHEFKRPPMFVCKAASDSEPTFDAHAMFASFKHERGRVPTYDEVAYGTQAVSTGRMQAAADGSQVPEIKWRRTRSKRAHIDPATFNPDFDAVLRKAQRSSLSREVGRSAHTMRSNGLFVCEEGFTEVIHDD